MIRVELLAASSWTIKHLSLNSWIWVGWFSWTKILIFKNHTYQVQSFKTLTKLTIGTTFNSVIMTNVWFVDRGNTAPKNKIKYFFNLSRNYIWTGVENLKLIMFKCQSLKSGHEYFLQVERNGHEPRIRLDFKSVSVWLIYMTHQMALTWTVGITLSPTTVLDNLINPILWVKLYHFCNSLLLTLIWIRNLAGKD